MFGLFASKPTHLPIYLLNSATRTKERFQPLKKKTVLMYACGPTVYDHIHIGNLRAYLLPDILHRLFLYNGYTVRFTVNVTDFGHLTSDGDTGEDKMMKGMRREGYAITLENMRSFAEPYIESFSADLAAFGNLTPTTLARASDYVPGEIALIETLEEKGYAYETSDGVYFDITRFPAYGIIGNVDVAQQRAGARVESNSEKRNPADFALWKKGDLGWKSKWGLGFPGWHIECTAMVFSTLGKQIDIHTGGEDLMYTHHNGEIAQAEALTGKRYVGYWLHNAHLTIDADKVAKSLGNGIRLAELVERGYTPEDYRYWLLTGHYRSPMNFTYDALDAAQQAMRRLKRVVYHDFRDVRASRPDEGYETAFITALSDDLDTPQALAVLWDLVKDDGVTPEAKLATLHMFDSLLSLNLSKPHTEADAILGYVPETEIPKHIRALVAAREDARAKQDWATSDEIREKLAIAGFTVEDTPDGPRVSVQS